MDMTVRQRAHQLEMAARQMAPATAMNALAVRCAQLESKLAFAETEIAQLRADRPDITEYVGSGDGPVG